MLQRCIPGGLVALVLVALPSDSMAQACVGLGTFEGQGFLVGQAAFTEGAWGPGGTVGFDTSGPATVAASFQHILLDNTDAAVSGVSGGLAIEIPDVRISVCPTVGVGYQWLSNDAGISGLDASGFSFGGGVAVGHRFDSRSANFSFIPSISAGVEHSRASLSLGGESVTGSDTYGTFSGGFAILLGRVFLGPVVGITTQDGSDPTLVANLGVIF